MRFPGVTPDEDAASSKQMLHREGKGQPIAFSCDAVMMIWIH